VQITNEPRHGGPSVIHARQSRGTRPLIERSRESRPPALQAYFTTPDQIAGDLVFHNRIATGSNQFHTLWLTDYLLAENLKLAYDSRQAAVSPAPGDAPPAPAQAQQGEQGSSFPLTPEVKQMIAEEVKQQLAAEQAISGQTPSPQPTGGAVDEAPPALDPRQRVFVISSTLDVAAAGQTCALTPGDIILRTDDAAGDGNTVGVSVLNSKSGDCPVNSSARMEVAALQEMHNQFREKIASGLTLLADNHGKSGLPAGPAPGARQVREGQAAPDLNVDKALLAQQQDANQIEAEARQAAASAQGTAN